MNKYRLWEALIFSLSFFSLAATQSNACNLVVKTIKPGYAPNGYNDVTYRTRITCTGDVVKGHQIDSYTTWQEETIAQLSSSEVAELFAALKMLKEGPLVVPPGRGYADTPTIKYMGNNDQGEWVLFAEFSFGQWGRLESFLLGDKLKQQIDSF